MIVISSSEVGRLLEYVDCERIMRDALSRWSDHQSVAQPLRTVLKTKGGLMGLMPCGSNVAPYPCSVKVISVIHGGAKSHQGLLLLFDGEKGNVRALMDAGRVTAIRTACCSALATELLMRQDLAKFVVAIAGTGLQAREHVHAFCSVFKDRISRFQVWGRNPEHAERVATEMRATYGPAIEFVTCASVRECIEGAHVINTVTASSAPILEGEWLQPGQHINAVGACQPAQRELDALSYARARLYCDSIESLRKESGGFITALAEGAITDDHPIGEIGQLAVSACEGRQSAGDITLFKSLGLAVEDLFCAQHIYARAEAEGLGLNVEL